MMQRPAAGPRLAIQYRELESPEEKEKIARAILEQLPDWFGLADSREEYIRQQCPYRRTVCHGGGPPAPPAGCGPTAGRAV